MLTGTGIVVVLPVGSLILLGPLSILSSGDTNLGGLVQKQLLLMISVSNSRSDAGPSLGRSGAIEHGVMQALAQVEWC